MTKWTNSFVISAGTRANRIDNPRAGSSLLPVFRGNQAEISKNDAQRYFVFGCAKSHLFGAEVSQGNVDDLWESFKSEYHWPLIAA